MGLIEELVTGPPWKIISKEKDVVNMYAHYQDFLSFFKSSADDASAFGKGNKTASFGNNFQWIGCSNQTDAIQVLTPPMLRLNEISEILDTLIWSL